jgi:4,5-DOPA dioxygenase extradiol
VRAALDLGLHLVHRVERRSLLQCFASALAMPSVGVTFAGCARLEKKAPMVESESTNVSAAMPVIFAAHGAPMLLEDARWMEELAVWARSMPKPKAVLVISAHWESRPTTLGATETVPLVYDFYGFPAHFYQTQYPAPGAPALAARVRQLLSANGLAFRDDAKRGLDHGAYVPLVAMYPAADVPVLQVSLPALDTGELFRLGNTLAPLRAEGVLIFGSGFLTHNMSYAFRPGTPAWATEFDQWVAESLTKGDVDALLDFQERAPAARVALPTWEHYAPLLVSVGAALPPNAGVPSGQVQFPITGWWMDGAFTRRSVQFS